MIIKSATCFGVDFCFKCMEVAPLEFLLALQFLTMIPITVRGKVDESNLARCMAWFPLVGLILGVTAALVYWVLSEFLPGSVCDLFIVLFIVVITGNMHGDGLMDTVDGIFSGRPRERILEIMKDSRVGSHGVAAGVFDILARFVLLGQIPAGIKVAALIIIPVLGRWAQVYGAVIYPYARAEGGTGSFADKVGRRELLWASVTVLAAVIAAFGGVGLFWQGVAVVLGTMAGIAWSGRYISRKLGGLTGDTYGAMNEFAEITALVVMLIVFRG